MTDLNIYTATFNCGRTLVDIDHFAASFFDGLKTNVPPDLVVLLLQEIAPIGYSFLGGSYLTPYFDRFVTAVQAARGRSFESEEQYEHILTRNVGMTALMVFGSRDMQDQIRRIETAEVGVGVWEMGNKGAVGARLWVKPVTASEEIPLTLVAAHLAPMENAWERRNADWKSICQGLVFQKHDLTGIQNSSNERISTVSENERLLSGSHDSAGGSDSGSLFSPVSHIFFGGDLNYRTADTGPQPDDASNWPQPVEHVSDVHHYSHMLDKDQLNRERKKGSTLHNLDESEITFPPTYKYSEEAQRQAARAPTQSASRDGDSAWLWAKHRVPSWCDRILYLASAPPKVHSYTALPVQPTSDHRPVVLSSTISLKAVAETVKPPFTVNPGWREARAAARRYEWAVGVAAYLGLTTEGEIMVGGSVIGILALVYLLR